MMIDFHTHTFPEKIAAGVISQLQEKSRSRAYTAATPASLLESMAAAGIQYSVTLPVMTNGKQVEKLNTLAIRQMEMLLGGEPDAPGLIPFGGMHPDYEDYQTELRRLKDGGIPGIKLHPAYQGVDFDDIRFLRIVDAASELGLIVLIHAGLDIGIPGHNYASVDQILHVIREVAPPKLVAAHMGGWRGWRRVKSDLAGAPLWLDTAFSLGRIEPPEGMERAPEESEMMGDGEFAALARAHGTDRILFATDCPWSDQKTYADRFRKMDLTAKEKADILGDNARRLLSGLFA